MKAVRQFATAVIGVAILLAVVFALYALVKRRPQDMPWTPLDLAETPGLFTGGKLVRLREDPAQCRMLLDKAGVRYTALPPLDAAGPCGYSDGIRLRREGPVDVAFAPARLGTSCPVAAALAMLDWNVLQPAARRHFGQDVRTVEHFGSYNCRRMYGRSTGDWSEHASANAVDLSGFVLDDGTRITVVRDWTPGESAAAAKKAAFLRDVRDGACKLFGTVLSPDYNAAHRDHFHLDQANRGMMGWRACR